MNAPCKVQAPYCLIHEMLYTRDSREVWGCPTCRILDAKFLAKHSAGKYQREPLPAERMYGNHAYDEVAKGNAAYAADWSKR